MKKTKQSLNLAKLLYLKSINQVIIDPNTEEQIKIRLSRFLKPNQGAKIEDENYKFCLVRVKGEKIPGTDILNIKIMKL